MAGRHLARWTMKHWKGNAEQVILLGVDAAGPLLNARLTGMVDGIGELLPNASGIPNQHYDTKGGQFEATLDLVRKHLRRYKTVRTLVGAVNDTTAMAALQAFREVGLEKECAIAGQDGSVLAREEMRRPFSRLVCSVAYFAETYGVRVIQLALDILNRKSVPPAIFIQHELLTPENVAELVGVDNAVGYCHHGTVLTGTNKGDKVYLCEGVVSRVHLISQVRTVKLTLADARAELDKALPLAATALTRAAVRYLLGLPL